jgi:phosphate starvation-inducible PhoH-like protein
MQGQEFETATQPRRKGSRKTQAQGQENVFNFNTFVQQRKTVNLSPKSTNQADYIDLLLNPEKVIVFATGPAGTGKTMLAVLAAIKALKSGQASKIIIARPAVAVDEENHGFLPGTLLEKLLPWAIPIMDVFKEYYSTQEITRMLADETLELAALSMLRGRTFKDAFVIIDESQNTSVNMMRMVLTRIGDNSKMVITGDLKQHDKIYAKDNGLKDFTEKLVNSKSKTISIIQFTGDDIQRHPVVEEVLKLYGEI